MRKGSIGLTALLAALALTIPFSAQATAPNGSNNSYSGHEKVYWNLPAAYKTWQGDTPPPGDMYKQTQDPSIWPQTYDPNKSACGGWWQWDIYDTSNSAIKSALDHAKANGLTYMAVQEIEWGFEKQPDCKVPSKKIIPKAPTLTHPTGKCWAGEWKVADNGKIKLPKVTNAKWVGHGTAKTLTGLAPGTYEFTLKATKGAGIKDINGFVNGKIIVELLAPEATDNCGPPPAHVKKKKSKNWTIDCEAGEATRNWTITTTEYVWSKHKHDWVLDHKNAQISTKPQTRALTEAETAQCPAPINVPPPEVIEGEWETTSMLCNLGVVSQMREVTTIEYGLVDGEVVEIDRTVVQERRDRPMNEDELAQCPDSNDPVVEPPPGDKPDPKPVKKPVAPQVIAVKTPTEAKAPAATAPKAQVQELPRTGSSTGAAALLASGLFVLGIGAVSASRSLRRGRQ